MANSGLWSDLHQNMTLTQIHHLFSVSASQHCTIDQVHQTFCYRMKAKRQASRPTEIYTWSILERNIQEKEKQRKKDRVIVEQRPCFGYRRVFKLVEVQTLSQLTIAQTSLTFAFFILHT